MQEEDQDKPTEPYPHSTAIVHAAPPFPFCGKLYATAVQDGAQRAALLASLVQCLNKFNFLPVDVGALGLGF